MSKLENKLIFLDEGESDSEDTKIIESLDLVIVQENGKRPLEQEEIMPTTEKNKIKNLKLSDDPSLQVLEHPSSNIMIIKGETTTTQSILEHYSDLNAQMKNDKQGKKSKLKSPSTPLLISALDKDKKILKVAVIQPSKAKDVSEDEVTKFKFNMNQFNVIDKVDLFK